MISAIITSRNEPLTIARAVRSIQSQLSHSDEIIVIAPDNETLSAARSAFSNKTRVQTLRDPGKGKPIALNLAVHASRGNLLLLTDGDVVIDKNALKNLKHAIKNNDAVTGRVVSSNSRNSIFGFWAFITTEAFHESKIFQSKNDRPILCSGYLYLVKKRIMPNIPDDALADDAFVSNHIINSNGKIAYEPRSKVFVKYPTTLIDWIRQKKRTAGRIYQSKINLANKIRELLLEARTILFIINRIREPREIIWFIALITMRFYIWARILFDYRLWHRSLRKTWERVETTK